jgi:pyruvate dehydrogenase phosphatase
MPENDSASADLRVVSVPPHLSDVVDTNDLFWRYDMDSYAANNHNEDRSQYVLERLPVPCDPSANDMDAPATASDASSVFFCGCYDGHGGEEAVEYVQRNLYRNIKQHLLSDSPSVTDAIVAGFQATDQQFHHRSLAQFEKGKWSSCSVGACAVVAMVVNQKLYVASCGDCRAIMAFRDPDGTLCVEQITLDHSANDAREQERLRILHPDELDIVREVGAQNFYVKGRLQPTRSLGDTYMKVQEVNRAPMPRGLRIRGSFTRPYISAVPDVFEVDLADRQPEFLVLGSDGLYGEMTNEEIASEVDVLRQQGVENVSQSLRTSVLERIAKYYGLSPGELEKIEPGDRRDYHDDITIDVLHFTAPACVAEEALPEAQAA